MANLKLPRVCGKHGAPLGRLPWPRNGLSEDLDLTQTVCFERKARCFKVTLDQGGYDEGGAYWGCGQQLWCVTNGFDNDDETFQMFFRAASRDDAMRQAEKEVEANPAIKLRWIIGRRK